MDVVSTAEVPAGERFAFWREVNSKLYVPYDLRCAPEAETGFRAHVGFSAFGPVQAVLATVVPHSAHRTPRLIRQADPEVFELACTMRGAGTVTQNDRRADLSVGVLVLVDTSRPYQVEHAPHVSASRVMLLHFPRSLPPLPSQGLRRLSGVRIPGTQGIGALSSQFRVIQVKEHSATQHRGKTMNPVASLGAGDRTSSQAQAVPHQPTSFGRRRRRPPRPR
ncbi:hypothetical protein [Streptomyces sp. NPDC005077]|uniref:cupin domain-containing protein n=1 Tax=Streptomyces sp. NPDC005077 TaxID=3154292 RepID=UPI0033A17852